MKRINSKILFFIISFACSIATAKANKTGISVGPTIGTLGLGIEARTKLHDGIFGRLGAHFINIEGDNFEAQSIKYNSKAEFINVPLMVDLHPFNQSGFRVSAGLAYSNNKITMKSDKNYSPFQTIRIDNGIIFRDELGDITHTATIGSGISPVFSIGYDNSGMVSGAFSFNCEVGAIYIGKAKIKSSITGPLKNDPEFMKEFNALQRDAQKQADKMTVYPIISVGFKVNF